MADPPVAPSGAETVLKDYLLGDDSIQPRYLFFDEGVAKFFEGVPGWAYAEVASYKKWRTSKVARVALMPLACAYNAKNVSKIPIVRSLLSKGCIDAVYLNNSYEVANYASAFEGVPVIAHVHDMVETFRPAYKRSVVRGCMSAHAVITPSDACKMGLVRLGVPPDRVVVAYNAIDVKHRRPPAIHEKETAVLGFVGTLDERKGFDLYVECLERMADSALRNIKGMIITKTTGEVASEKLIKKLRGKVEVELCRGVDRKSVLNKYREMDVLLVPSRHDPLPTVVLEATLSGTPVLGANQDGIPEMINDSSRLFMSGDVRDMQGRLERWLDLPSGEKEKSVMANQDMISSVFTVASKNASVHKAFRIAGVE